MTVIDLCVPDRALRWGGWDEDLDDFAPDLTAPGDVYTHPNYVPPRVMDVLPIVRAPRGPIVFDKGPWS